MSRKVVPTPEPCFDGNRSANFFSLFPNDGKPKPPARDLRDHWTG